MTMITRPNNVERKCATSRLKRNWPGAVRRGRLRSKARRALGQDERSPLPQTRLLGFSFLLLGCRCVCDWSEVANFDVRFAGVAVVCESVASALSGSARPHCDCLPRHDPQSIAPCFRLQSALCAGSQLWADSIKSALPAVSRFAHRREG